MIQLVTAGDKKYEITKRIPIPSKVDPEKLNKALEGVVFFQQPNDRAIYLGTEVVDAKFEDIVELSFEEKKKQLLEVMNQIKEEKKKEENNS